MDTAQANRQRYWKKALLSWLPAVGQAATLVIVATALLWPAPFTRDLLPAAWSGSDLVFSHWPMALLIQRTFAQGQGLPLWNPYFGGGLPMAGDPLAALFYPPTHLVHFFSLRDYFLILMLGHLVFAGLGMLLLARRAFGLPRLPALVAAVSFMATPRLIAHLGAGHITIFQTVAWFPWLALGCWATVQNPRRWAAFFGIALALMLLAGHPQMAYYGLLMTAGQAAWLLVKRWRQEGHRAFLKSVAGLAAAGGIGVLLAAIYLLPVMELTAHSTRQLSLGASESYPLENFLHALIGQFPPSGSRWESMLTPGLLVLALALFGVLTNWRKGLPLLLGIILVAGLAMGNASPFYPLVARILPGLDLFRALARIWFIALVLFALLAGLGADSLLRLVKRVYGGGTVFAGMLAVLAVALSLVPLDIIFGYAGVGNAPLTTAPSQLAITAARLAHSGRVYAVQENILQATAVQLQVRLADGRDPLLIQSYVSYMERAGGYSASGYQLHIPAYVSPYVKPDARLLGLMDVRIVLSRWPLSDRRLVLVEKVDGTLIYENTVNAGPGYLVKAGPGGSVPSLDQVQQLDVPVGVKDQSPQLSTFTFSTDTEAYFVIATPAFPGWIAELDGHAVPVEQIAGVLPAIKVGPGRHILSYRYAPSSVRNGALLSLAGLLAALAGIIIGRFWTPGRRRLNGRKQRQETAQGVAGSVPM